MPKRKPLQANLTAEQAELSNQLAIIRAALPCVRSKLVNELAAERGVHSRTVRRWAEIAEGDEGRLLIRSGRSDRGKFRIPGKATELILNYFWENPAASTRKAHVYLVENHTDDMTYISRSGVKRLVSIGSVCKIKRIFRKGWDSEVSRSRSPI